MKKIIALALGLLMVTAILVGCNGGKNTGESSLKTGLAIVTSIAKSKNAGEADGLAQADSTIAAVLVDANGKIVDCAIDAAQSKINFNSQGELTTALDTIFKTKNELGSDYNLGKSSSIGKEWNQQAAAFASYVKGKTISEVKGIAVNESGKPTGADLKSSVTVTVTDMIAAVEKAVANATDLGAVSGDKLSIATITNTGKSASATSEKAGLAQIYSTYVALTRDNAGKITSCVLDSSQTNINYDAAGQITTDLTAVQKTKNELKEAYNLAKSSSIGKEWYQQAASFANYVKGKTAAEVSGIAVDGSGKATSSDIKSSVTISITDFIEIVNKAAN